MAGDITPKNIRRGAASFAVAGLLLGGFVGYHALLGEFTGQTVAPKLNVHITWGKFSPVFRDSHPEEFRRANNLLWGLSVFGLGVGAVCFWYYRGLKDYD